MTRLPKTFTDRVKALGFTDPHVADLKAFNPDHEARLKDFTEKGYHGTMDWLAETTDRRRHPVAMWPEAKSAIVLGMNYGPETDPLASLSQPGNATISVYARNRDYHDIMKGRLKEAAGLLARDLKAEVKVFVDTAPLPEKQTAELAGLGWQGKHTNLVNRDYGSWLFLGTILTDAELTPGSPEIDHCGSCTECLDICPTNAFPAPYQLDARRCISYLTIEHKGPVDPELRPLMGNRIYGCDDCLAVCPWNKFAQNAAEIKLKARDDLNAPALKTLAKLSDSEFRKFFSGSPIKRIGRNRFIRNVLYAIGNSGSAQLKETAQAYTQDPDPVLADAALWAVNRLEDHV